MQTLQCHLADEASTEALGRALAPCLPRPGLITLSGDLGAGKTTLSRGILRGLGHQGSVKSPTYALVEPYELEGGPVAHFDLYRMGDPEEMEFLGFRDYQAEALCLVEWPQRAGNLLPKPELCLVLEVHGRGRILHITPGNTKGERLMPTLAAICRPWC